MIAADTILIPGSIGELFDKIAILEIKAARIFDPEKLGYVRRELALLRALEADCTRAMPAPETLVAELKHVNATLWEIEDAIRDCERRQDFGAEFIALARAVYKTNDRRAGLKRALNVVFGSEIVEQKSYAAQA